MRTAYYHLSHYISHRGAGRDYVSALAGAGVRMVEDPDEADILILHDDPLALADLIRKYRGRKYLVAYSVWETDILPVQYKECLEGVDRVWTCTPYSARAFMDAGFDPVDVVPHVVDLPEPTDADIAAVEKRLPSGDDCFYFYTVVDSVNPRKNLKALLHAFTAAFGSAARIRLVVKQYRHAWDLGSLPNVLGIDDRLTPGEMAALHRVCHAYVGTHHAEAWGLSLSDAMLAGNPVVATGYSGNMFYMDESNSLPVKYSLVPVSREMCELVPLFTPDMVWADIDMRHLSYLMRKAAEGRIPDSLAADAVRAMRPFAPDRIGALMKGILDGI